MQISLRTSTSLVILSFAIPAFGQEFESWRGYESANFEDAHYAWSMVAGDLDGDQRVDLVVGHLFNAGAISVLLNDGEAGFLPPVHLTQAAGPKGLGLLDLDADGDLDVLASNSGGNWEGSGLTRYLNDGEGGLSSPMSFPSVSGPAGMVVADFDRDGIEDVALAGYGFFGGGQQVALHLGDGLGGFEAPVLVQTGAAPYRLAAGDLDADGWVDLAVAREGRFVSVHLNQSGSLGAPVEYAIPGGGGVDIYPDVELFDADQDGDLDVAYTSTRTQIGSDSSFGAVAVLENSGTGALGNLVLQPVARYLGGGSGLSVADVNGDGWDDILTVHADAGGWSLVRSDGQGGFKAAEEIAGGQYLIDVLVEDVDGDGARDVLVLAHHTLMVTVHRNLGDGEFHHPQGTYVNPLSSDLDVADVDGDGDLDVAMTAAYAGSGNVEVAYNDGAGNFSAGSFFGSGGGAMAVKLRDLDGDGHLDLLWADDGTSPPYDFWTALNDGAGQFEAPVEWPVNTCGNGDVEAFDMDGDGDLDVFLSEYLGCFGGDGSRCFISENLGDGTFAAPVVYTLVLRPERIGHGDLDADGDEDVVFTDGGGLTIGLNAGDGQFGSPRQIALPGGAKDVEVAELDGDGILDIAACSWSGAAGDGARVSILWGLGEATFSEAEVHLGSYTPNLGNGQDLVLADFDLDGDLDLVTANFASNDVSVYTNLGNGSFTDQARFGAGPSPSAIGRGDMNGDGRPDLAVLVGVPPAELDRELIILKGLGAKRRWDAIKAQSRPPIGDF